MSEQQRGASNGQPMATRIGGGGKLARLWGCLGAILKQRCPRCRTGRLFRGRLTMNDPCPCCGLLFEREEGYFLGAMYFSYGLSSTFLVAAFFVCTALLPEWESWTVALLAVVAYLPFVPAVFRYSRVFWIYYDRLLCPGGVSAGAYEKLRQRQLERQKTGPPARDGAAPRS